MASTAMSSVLDAVSYRVKVLSALSFFCQGIFIFWTVELQYPGEQNCPLLYGFLDYYYLQFRKSTRSWGKRET